MSRVRTESGKRKRETWDVLPESEKELRRQQARSALEYARETLKKKREMEK